MKTFEKFVEKKILQAPTWLPKSVGYMTIMGSTAYGVSNDMSDIDVYGFCVPPIEMVFPHLSGEILGFGRQIQRFEVFQQHHVQDLSISQSEYDYSIYSVVKYFHLLMENNPNMIDSIFTPDRCVVYSTNISDYVRKNRKEFLHKGAMFKLRGYAHAQLAKIKNKTNSSNPKRKDLIAQFGYDTKFGMHLARLVLEAEQILGTHDLDLERDREFLKAIRKGEMNLNELTLWFTEKEKTLETLYANSTLRDIPDEGNIKQMLINCLEMYYGDLTGIIAKDTMSQFTVEFKKLLEKYRL